MKKMWLCHSKAQSWNPSLWLPWRYGKQGKNFFPASMRLGGGSDPLTANWLKSFCFTKMQRVSNVIRMGLPVRRPYMTEVGGRCRVKSADPHVLPRWYDSLFGGFAGGKFSVETYGGTGW